MHRKKVKNLFLAINNSLQYVFTCTCLRGLFMGEVGIRTLKACPIPCTGLTKLLRRGHIHRTSKARYRVHKSRHAPFSESHEMCMHRHALFLENLPILPGSKLKFFRIKFLCEYFIALGHTCITLLDLATLIMFCEE